LDAIELVPDLLNRPKSPIEFETLPVIDRGAFGVTVQDMSPWGKERWSDGKQVFCRATQPGAKMVFELSVQDDGLFEIVLYATRAPDYGTVSISIDKTFPLQIPGYAPTVIPSGPVSLGTHGFAKGRHPVRVEVIAKDPASSNYFFGLDALELVPQPK
jgi:hypothetical protein